MKLIKRLKNLWRLSAYRVNDPPPFSTFYNEPMLVKDIPTIKKKLATIIPEKTEDPFEPPKEDD